jgi:DNA-binding CsgD family transcriptional regulator
MARADTILTAVHQIYDKTLEPGGWSAVLPSVAAALRSRQSILVAQNVAGGAADICGSAGAAPEDWARFAAAVSAGLAPSYLQLIQPARAVQSSAMQSDRDFERSAFYNEFVRPVGAFYAMLTSPVRTHEQRVFFIVARDLGREDYDREDVAAMKVVVPHVATAFRIGFQLRGADLRAASAVAALDRLDSGVVLLDEARRIVFTNRAAEVLLDGGNGLRVDADGLSAVDAATDDMLRGAIVACRRHDAVSNGPGRAVDVPRDSDRAPLRILVAPCGGPALQQDSGWLGHARPAAMLLITDPERDRSARRDALRRRFGLTPAEANVASEIIRGDGREAAAARLGISVSTARTHLTNIFEKTGARRQAALVRLLLNHEYAEGSDHG